MTEARSLDFRISNALEPFDSLPDPLDHALSQLGCWIPEHRQVWNWKYSYNPVDWLAPANNWRLIVELLFCPPDGGMFVTIEPNVISLEFRNGGGWLRHIDKSCFAEAVRDAFARVKGITADTTAPPTAG